VKKINIILVLLIFLFLCGCDFSNDTAIITTLEPTEIVTTSNIYINGDVTMQVEVLTEFIDPGITIPDEYTLYIDGEVNTIQVGENILKYTILDEQGVVAKEITRIVNVVDTTPPEIIINSNPVLYLGIGFDFNEIYTIYDNYYSDNQIIVSSNYAEINPNNLPGIFDVRVTAEDLSGNESVIDFSLEIKLDYFYIIESLNFLENGISSIEYDETGPNPGLTCWVNFQNGDRINISETGDFWFVLSYMGSVTGLVFFSGSFDNMTDTDISISVRQLTSSTSSWLRLNNFDASLDYDKLDLSQSAFTNEGDVNYSQALAIFNEYGLIALNRVKSIYEEILGLDFD